jgi:hypothetical protein
VWVLGGRNDALQHVWSGNVAHETAALLQFDAAEPRAWAQRMAQVGSGRIDS